MFAVFLTLIVWLTIDWKIILIVLEKVTIQKKKKKNIQTSVFSHFIDFNDVTLKKNAYKIYVH